MAHPPAVGPPDRYEGDFLALRHPATPPLTTLPDGCFDAVFDRGGLVAVDPKDREKYAMALKRLVAPGG